MNKSPRKKGQLRGALSILLLIFSTTLCFIPIFLMGLLKLLPHQKWQIWCARSIDKVVKLWSDFNNFYINHFQKIRWQINSPPLSPNDWYLVVANHQSWLDIVLLQWLFNRKIPVLKFFIKDQLKWVPLLGFAWWAMGSPFMKRYSKEYLHKNPHKSGQDLEATRKALNLFRQTPSSVMNFIEGTRFSDAKNRSQGSPYKNLLKPKAGGISFVIQALGNQINHLVDVTIVYSNENHSLWDFLCHRIDAISIHVRKIPIPEQFLVEECMEKEHTQFEFREWLNQHWAAKDQLIMDMQKG